MPQPNITAEIINEKELPESSHRLPSSQLLHSNDSLFLHLEQSLIYFSLE